MKVAHIGIAFSIFIVTLWAVASPVLGVELRVTTAGDSGGSLF